MKEQNNTIMLFGQKVIIEERANDFHAHIQGHRGTWGCGKTWDEAIGSFVRTWSSHMGLPETPKPVVADVNTDMLSVAEDMANLLSRFIDASGIECPTDEEAQRAIDRFDKAEKELQDAIAKAEGKDE